MGAKARTMLKRSW